MPAAAKYEEGIHPLIEAYRGIRTNILVDKNLKSILITSSDMGEGKTTTTVNLAKCFANLYTKEILIVDCDLRRPSIHKHFQLENKLGLTDILSGDKAFYDCVHKKGNLSILTSGTNTNNPSELLESKYMINFIRGMETKYDYVFIDSPPVSRVNDACIIAQNVDGTVVVCGSGDTNSDLVKVVKNRLEKVNANLVGVVLNKLNIKVHSYFNYYSYYGEEEQPKKFRFRKKRK